MLQTGLAPVQHTENHRNHHPPKEASDGATAQPTRQAP